MDARAADARTLVIRSRAFLSCADAPNRPASGNSGGLFASSSFHAVCLEAALPTSVSALADAGLRLRVARAADFRGVRALFCACMQEHREEIPVRQVARSIAFLVV
jgi:hypothetical protein